MASSTGKRKDSALRKRRELDQATRRARDARKGRPAVHTELGDVDAGPGPLPRWYKAVMFGLMVVGLLWIVTYYLSQGLLPIVQIGGWNIAVGVGIALVGFLMMSRWSE